MGGYRFRHAVRSDAAAVTQIVRDIEDSILGRADFTLADLEDEWRTLSLEEDAWVAVPDDRPESVAGYATLISLDGLARSDGYVAPAHIGRGVGGLIVDWLEDQARARNLTRVRNAVLDADTPARELLVAHGYHEVRRFWQMRIDLGAEEPTAPDWPVELQVHDLDPAEQERFYDALAAAFEDHWGSAVDPYAEFAEEVYASPGFEPSLCPVVKADGHIVAGAICARDRMGAGWVSYLFTAREWRGRGVGAAVLQDAFGRLWRAGRRTVGLGVDAHSDTGANRLYLRAGMHVHWAAVVYAKELA